LDIVGDPKDLLNEEQILVWQHQEASKVCQHLLTTLLENKSGIWRGNYLCSKTTSAETNTIPQEYIANAFRDLHLTGTIIDNSGLCIYFPGGLAKMKTNLSVIPYLVHGDAVNSGNRIVNPVEQSIQVLECSELIDG
jgi:hypothetical protein